MAKNLIKLTRRGFLNQSLALGCSAAASPLVTPVTWAATPGDARLVVIVLRGGMDGLDMIQPVGDKNLSGLRKTLTAGEQAGAHDLDGFFALNDALGALTPLWARGELAFAHAVSTPYRDKRSHFDGQDVLETGSAAADGTLLASGDGWLNRMLSLLPGSHAEMAYAVGRGQLKLLSGDAPATSWSPEADLDLSPQAQLLLTRIYAKDPLFKAATEQAFAISQNMEGGAMNGRQAARAEALAGFAADRMNEAARITAFSLGGWDTHKNQAAALGRAGGELATAILTLRARLGVNWGQTTVVAVTEFGRTARENGSRGTDHGTGGAMVVAGGALAKAQVVTQWPGLRASDLYRERDLMPTRDLRAHLGWILRQNFSLAKSDIEQLIFPGVDLDANPGWLA